MSLFLDFKKKLRKYGLEWFGRYYGVYRGSVYSNADPKKLGRIRVLIPSIYGSQSMEYWALPKGQYSGKDKGFFAIPEEKDNIWITFEGGDIRFPVWEYGWRSTPMDDDAKPGTLVLKTTKGHKIVIKDDAYIRIQFLDGRTIQIDEKISLGSEGNSNEAAALGDTLKAQLLKLSTRVTVIEGSIDASVFATDFSGAALKASLVSGIAANKVPTNIESWDNILSKIVTLD